MTFEEKGHWIFLVTCIVTYGVYVGIILNMVSGTALADVNYGMTMLWTIIAAVVLSIVGMIGVAIAKPSEADKRDARDKEINRFGEYVSGVVLSCLMIIPLIFAVMNFDQFWIANTMYAVFVLSGIVGAVTKIVTYRRG
jgi:cobalamin synthase